MSIVQCIKHLYCRMTCPVPRGVCACRPEYHDTYSHGRLLGLFGFGRVKHIHLSEYNRLKKEGKNMERYFAHVCEFEMYKDDRYWREVMGEESNPYKEIIERNTGQSFQQARRERGYIMD